ncbi:MAG: selenide, water dikinase SelD, partial [Chloroflexi bacterium]|nr:selenide, water dikinase SelD [Chloroflexota bacterium]
GAIAAANALSDVYAMGARPLFALNVVNFPRDTLPLDLLERVLEGGAAKVAEAGAAILGGHSIDDPEPKYGLVALGSVHPERIVRNVGARPGDALLLTKPLGMGVLTTAIKRGLASASVVDRAVEVMSTLNRAASEVMVASGAVHAATDVTGFGLLGHLSEMLGDGSVGVQVEASAVPVLDAVWELVRNDVVPGGTRRNLASVESVVDWSERLAPEQRLVLADAQTSGGLLMAVEPSASDGLLAELHRNGVAAAARIGTFTDRRGRIQVL